MTPASRVPRSDALAVLGAGGHARVVADAALRLPDWCAIRFHDDDPAAMTHWNGHKLCGTIAERLRDADAAVTTGCVALGIGDNAIRQRLGNRCVALELDLRSIVHPMACLSPFSSFGSGAVAFAGACVNVDARIGRFAIVNTNASVDHDCVLDEAVHIAPGATLAGAVQVGQRSFIGAGAVVREGVRIGCDVLVAAGSAVVADVADGMTVGGVPARPLTGGRR